MFLKFLMMGRRTTPQKKTDEAAVPVRVRFAIPAGGFGLRLDDLHRWLANEIGRGEYAVHSSPALAMDDIGVYLRDADCAQALVKAFPDFTLADGLGSRAYYSPAHDRAWSGSELFGVCNLYSMTKAQTAIRELFDGIKDETGNLPPQPEIYPDRQAPVVANTPEGLKLTMMRLGTRCASTDSGTRCAVAVLVRLGSGVQTSPSIPPVVANRTSLVRATVRTKKRSASAEV